MALRAPGTEQDDSERDSRRRQHPVGPDDLRPRSRSTVTVRFEGELFFRNIVAATQAGMTGQRLDNLPGYRMVPVV